MTKEQLAQKYPAFTVRSDPSPSCPVCKGNGEYTSKMRDQRLCLCACISGSDSIRNLAAEVLHRKIWQKK